MYIIMYELSNLCKNVNKISRNKYKCRIIFSSKDIWYMKISTGGVSQF